MYQTAPIFNPEIQRTPNEWGVVVIVQNTHEGREVVEILDTPYTVDKVRERLLKYSGGTAVQLLSWENNLPLGIDLLTSEREHMYYLIDFDGDRGFKLIDGLVCWDGIYMSEFDAACEVMSDYMIEGYQGKRTQKFVLEGKTIHEWGLLPEPIKSTEYISVKEARERYVELAKQFAGWHEDAETGIC